MRVSKSQNSDAPDIFYNGNPKLKRSGVKQNYSVFEQEEFVRCKLDVIYFVKTYVNTISLDEGMVKLVLFPYQERMITHMDENRFSIFMTSRQMGKALDVETPILTPSGFVPMGSLQVGDTIYGADGKKTKISFITPTMHDHRVAEVKFAHGETIKADYDHLWNVQIPKGKGFQTVTKTTAELMPILSKLKAHGQALSIQMNGATDLGASDVPIDPYLYGVWLGDGATADGRISCHVGDYPHYKMMAERRGYAVGEFKPDSRRPNTGTFVIPEFRKELREGGFLGENLIPDSLVFTSIQNRMDLVRGLMDADGTVEKNGVSRFYQSDAKLAERVRFVLSSLGIKSTSREKPTTHKVCHILTFATSQEICTLPRKLERLSALKGHRKNQNFYISEIVDCESVPVRCLQVENDDHLFLCGKTLIPTHNTTVAAAYLLHQLIFNKKFTVAILANKGEQATEIMDRVKMMYEELPFFLQPGVSVWNTKSIKLGNGSRGFTAATSSGSIRGKSINILYMDEFAHIENDAEFYQSTYPVIMSGKNSKVIITSTPNGMNLFYKIWTEGMEGRSNFKPLQIYWHEHPKRDAAWLKEQEGNMPPKQIAQEIHCQFHGSSDTLISGSKLQKLAHVKPQEEDDTMQIYSKPVPGRSYVAVADTSEGVGRDSSVCTIIDASEAPYRIVAKYRSNIIPPLLFAKIVNQLGHMYNEACVVVESNSVGSIVCNELWHTYEYENMITTKAKDGENAVYGGARAIPGVKTTVRSKSIGCSVLKSLIESDTLIVQDFDTISELATFCAKGKSYEATKGKHDDCVMALVLFAWFTNEPYFAEMVDVNVRGLLRERLEAAEEFEMLIGYFVDGTEEVPESFPF